MANLVRTRSLAALFGVAFVAALPGEASAVTMGQVDDFQNGTLMGWRGNTGNQENVANGGPNGTGDRYMRVLSDGSSFPGGKMATYNMTQWSGNYTAAGVKVVTVWFRNESTTPLRMRLVMFDATVSTQWVSTTAQAVPADNTWRKYTYVISQSQMTRTVGIGSFDNTVANANRMMFRHEGGAPASQGTPVDGLLGIDNVTALAGVEVGPGSFAVDAGSLVGGGLSELQSSNNQYVSIQNDEFDPDAAIRCEGTSSLSSTSAISIDFEYGGSRNDMFATLQLWDFVASNWVTVATGTVALSDTTLSARITTNPSRFIGPSGLLRMRGVMFTVAEVSGFDGWAQRIDMVRWTIEP